MLRIACPFTALTMFGFAWQCAAEGNEIAQSMAIVYAGTSAGLAWIAWRWFKP